MEKLEQQLDLPRVVRVHFTGCPNSCGQAQVRLTPRLPLACNEPAPRLLAHMLVRTLTHFMLLELHVARQPGLVPSPSTACCP